MRINLKKILLGFLSYCCLSVGVSASEEKVPEPFRGHTANSPYEISYHDLDIVLSSSVLETGKSRRSKAKATKANIGTRMKAKKKRLTSLEGNRFWFEAFRQEEVSQLLLNIRQSLEKVPSEIMLKDLSQTEQLAYWLNLYNVTLLSEIIARYPKKSLKSLLTGSDSILDKKLLTVSEIKLSLNDIHHNILMQKFNGDPLIIYGLYQGIIGGPNIRKRAFTGKNVVRALQANAREFINSNRGTYAGSKKNFRVSSLYERNKQYFPDFDGDLSEHLLDYLEGRLTTKLKRAKRIKANINDWKIADLFGSTPTYGGSVNSNNAALLDSAGRPEQTGVELHYDGEVTARPIGNLAGGESGNSGFINPSLSTAAESMIALTKNYGRFSREQMQQLQAMHKKRMESTGFVKITQDNKEVSDEDKKTEQEN